MSRKRENAGYKNCARKKIVRGIRSVSVSRQAFAFGKSRNTRSDSCEQSKSILPNARLLNARPFVFGLGPLLN
ncbi:MAG: hypothetical protein DBX55_04980 [Verrucomicrobia bacterium]|nr:MAG: hypothetical protein DBX55_04980 [Verrucomicrobiota bacterium]